MSTATFTVPLTARVLRAILADMEGTEGLLGGCGCIHGPLTSGIVEEGNPYVVPAPIILTEEEGNPYVVPAPIILTEEEAAEAKRRYILETALAAPTVNPFIGTLPETDGDYTDEQMEAEVNASIGAATAFPGSYIPVPAPPVVIPELAVTPPATVTPPAPPVASVPLDGEGLPWDKRIHASTKTKRIGDNTWKLARGIDAETVERVKAELRATMSAGTVPTPAPPATVPALSGSYVAPNYSGAQSGGYAPIPPTIAAVETVPTTTVPQPPSVTAAVPPPVPTPAVFSEFVTWVTGKLVAKEFSRDQLQAACAAEGIMSMPMLENRPDLVPAIWKFLESICIPMSSVGGV